MLRKLLATNHDGVLTALRLVLGVVFFAHGSQKLLGWFGGFGYDNTMTLFTQHLGIPPVLATLAIAAEFFGGIGLILGLAGRVAAFGIVMNMLVAIAKVHSQFGFFMNWTGTQQGEGFEYHLLVLAIGLALIIRGSGAFSIDGSLANFLGRQRSSPVRVWQRRAA
jgi:putative oxidoreductase